LKTFNNLTLSFQYARSTAKTYLSAARRKKLRRAALMNYTNFLPLIKNLKPRGAVISE